MLAHRNLMARQDLKELGFQGSSSGPKQDTSAIAKSAEQAPDEAGLRKRDQQGSNHDASKRKREGFVAGLRR